MRLVRAAGFEPARSVILHGGTPLVSKTSAATYFATPALVLVDLRGIEPPAARVPTPTADQFQARKRQGALSGRNPIMPLVFLVAICYM